MKKKTKKAKKNSVKPSKKKVAAPKDEKLKIVNLKINGKDRRALTAQAKKYADGNLSAWLRHTGLKYVPKKGEPVSVKAYK